MKPGVGRIFARALAAALLAGGVSCGALDGDDGGGEGGGTEGDICTPGANYCAGEDGDEVWQCNDAGTGGRFVEDCGDLSCWAGSCVTDCERAARDPSNVGCEFWAVDLPNEAFDMGLGVSNDAAAQQFAVAIANENDYPVEVTIWRNAARFGDPVAEEVVTTVTVAPEDMQRIDLPQREVNGTMGQNASYVRNSGSGTFVSSHGYRIVTSGPVVAYQFNPIVQQYSNDASVLIPVQALGDHYYVVGWPTANPCGPPPGDPLHQESVPDHTAVTIVGAHPDTEVQIVPTHPIAASGGMTGAAIAATPAGQPIQLTIGAYDVVNLSSDQPRVPIQECFNQLDRDGDLTGTLVVSDRPVAVFSSLERGIGLGGAQPPDPPGWDGETCCTDHLEEQMLPTAALGWEFVVSRSPIRSTDPSYAEPDLYRILGTVDGTTVTTNLPAPHDRFQVGAGQHVTFHADRGFTARAEGGAIVLAQVLVSQGYIPQGGIGDPTLIVFPPAEQHRDGYLFLVPPTFSQNYMVLALPDGAQVTVDGLGIELMTGCTEGAIGDLGDTRMRQLTCAVSEGVHRVEADRPVGLTVYGYYSVGSYGYPGGADMEIINPVE